MMRIQISKRAGVSRVADTLIRIGAIIASLLLAGAVMAIMGFNPLNIFSKIITSTTSSFSRFSETINKTILLTTLSLGIAVAFRMKFWNIGAEGQFYMGAFGATWAVMLFPQMPAPVLIPLMTAFGFAFGGLFALIPAALKIKWGASETLVTLMLNYIAQKWVGYLQYGPWRDPKGNGFPRIARFDSNAILPNVFGIHIGWIITIILAVLLFFLLSKTKFGYEVSVIGESLETAKYAGINVRRTMIFAVIISGGLCGLAGMMQASAIENSLTDNMSNGLGFTAVITTWLSQLNPLVMIAVSFLFSMLLQGGSFLQSSMQIPASMAQILQGIIIFFVLGSEFFVKYRISFSKRTVLEKNTGKPLSDGGIQK